MTRRKKELILRIHGYQTQNTCIVVFVFNQTQILLDY